MNDLFDLTGKVAIVTGGGRGLGRSIALGLAAAGADVVLASRKAENCEQAAEQCRALGRRAIGTACHMGRPDQIDALFDLAIEQMGRVDILINNSATSPSARPLVDGTPELFDKIFAINVRGPLQLASRCAPSMAANGGGSIVNMISIGGLKPGPWIGLYCSSKAALHSLTRCMAIEWADQGVRVNAVAPGPFLTDMVTAVESEEFRQGMIDQTAVRRIGEPEEIVGTILYLVSGASTYTTGSVVTVDGGAMA